MSVNISVSSIDNRCDDILQKLLKHNINCRLMNTTSIVDNNIEKGCLLTFSKKYNSKESVNKLWEIINLNNDYKCAYLKIDGIFNGCIFNYTKSNNCP